MVVQSAAMAADARAHASVRVADDAKRLDRAIEHWARRWRAYRADALVAWETWSQGKHYGTKEP